MASGCSASGASDSPNNFDVNRAMSLIDRQVGVGQRPAGSRQLRHLATKLRPLLPDGRFEPFRSKGPQQRLRNIVGVIPGSAPAILLGAHYDTQYRPKGFVGANDSAAGTAAVIELSRDLRTTLPAGHREIRFVLFDGEEAPPGCRDRNFQNCALRGSRAYAAAHRGQIGDMILLDYIANRGAQFPRETNSNVALWEQMRAAAGQVGDESLFPPTTETPIIDDHIPFLAQGIPSIDLIDWSYPYKNGVHDTLDKLDPGVLDQVGESVYQLLVNLSGTPQS